MRFLNAKSKRKAVVTALREFSRRRRMARLVRFSATCDFVDNDTLEAEEMMGNGSAEATWPAQGP